MDGPTPALWLGHSVTRRVQQQWRRRSASSAAAGEVFAATDSLTAEEYLLHVRYAPAAGLGGGLAVARL